MIQGEYVPKYFVWSGTGMEQVWNGYGTDTQLNIAFQVLPLMVWNRGVGNGIRGLDPELWIGVWIGTCARACSAPFILSGSHISKTLRKSTAHSKSGCQLRFGKKKEERL